MKTTILILALALAGAVFADPAPAPTKPEAVKPAQDPVTVDAYNKIKKELEDGKAELLAHRNQSAQQQQAIQQLQILAERNELAVRVLQQAQQIEHLQKQLTDTVARTDDLQKQLAEATKAAPPKK